MIIFFTHIILSLKLFSICFPKCKEQFSHSRGNEGGESKTYFAIFFNVFLQQNNLLFSFWVDSQNLIAVKKKIIKFKKIMSSAHSLIMICRLILKNSNLQNY